MLPWKTIILLDKSSETPVYLQLANAIINEIKQGVIKAGTRMPGTRMMAEALKLHRQTVVKSYDELYSQGWFVSVQSKGTFVSEKLPEISPKKFTADKLLPAYAVKTGYNFIINSLIHDPADPAKNITGFHDGSDLRFVPVDLISRGYKRVLQRKSNITLLGYTDVAGRPVIREALSDYLNSSRGLQTESENIIVTRGAQMALYILSETLISKDDIVIAGDTSFRLADLTFLQRGARIVRVAVDANGLDVNELEKVCRKKKVRAVYITPHHHYPTTVTLSADRRMRLLQLAEQYEFIIIEDDYDYEFHFESSPILPLASADKNGMVVYIGSFSKTLSPAIRVGYVAAPVNLIQELSKVRQIVDAQGDPVLEQVLAEMLNEGEVRRHMKKALRIYRERRDNMCALLKNELNDLINFKVPEGGLCIWTAFDKRIPVPLLSDAVKKKGIALPKGLLHDKAAGKKLNSTRLGFGWMNPREAEKAISILSETMRKWK